MDNELRQKIVTLLQPVFTGIVNNVAIMIDAMSSSLPPELSNEQRKQLLTQVITQHTNALKLAVENSVPTDFDVKLKEAADGGK